MKTHSDKDSPSAASEEGERTRLRRPQKACDRRLSVRNRHQPANHARRLACSSQNQSALRHTFGGCTTHLGIGKYISSWENLFLKDLLRLKQAASVERLEQTLASAGYRLQREVFARRGSAWNKNTKFFFRTNKHQLSPVALTAQFTESRPPASYRILLKKCEARRRNRYAKKLFFVAKHSGHLTCRKSYFSACAKALREGQVGKTLKPSLAILPPEEQKQDCPAYFSSEAFSGSEKDSPFRVKGHDSRSLCVGCSTRSRSFVTPPLCCGERNASPRVGRHKIRTYVRRRSQSCVLSGSVPRSPSAHYHNRCASEDYALSYEHLGRAARTSTSGKHRSKDSSSACPSTSKFVLREHCLGHELPAGFKRRRSGPADHVSRCSSGATAAGTSNETSFARIYLKKEQLPRTPANHEEEQYRRQCTHEHYLKDRRSSSPATESNADYVHEIASRTSPVSVEVDCSKHSRQRLKRLDNGHHSTPQRRFSGSPNELHEHAEHRPQPSRGDLSAKQLQQLQPHAQQQRRRELPESHVLNLSSTSFHKRRPERPAPSLCYDTILRTGNPARIESTTATYSSTSDRLHNESSGGVNSYIESLPALFSSVGALLNALFTTALPSTPSRRAASNTSRLSSHAGTAAAAPPRRKDLKTPYPPEAAEAKRTAATLSTEEGGLHSDSTSDPAGRRSPQFKVTLAKHTAAHTTRGQDQAGSTLSVLTPAAGDIRGQGTGVAPTFTASSAHDHPDKIACSKQSYAKRNQADGRSQQQEEHVRASCMQSSPTAESGIGDFVAFTDIEGRAAVERRAQGKKSEASTDGGGGVRRAANAISDGIEEPVITASADASTLTVDFGVRRIAEQGSRTVRATAGLSGDDTKLDLRCDGIPWKKKSTGFVATGCSKRSSATTVIAGEVNSKLLSEAYAEKAALVATRNTIEALVDQVPRGSGTAAATASPLTTATATKQRVAVSARRSTSVGSKVGRGVRSISIGKGTNRPLQEQCSHCCRVAECEERTIFRSASQQYFSGKKNEASGPPRVRSQLQTSSTLRLPGACTSNGSWVFRQRDILTEGECGARRLQLGSETTCSCALSDCSTSSSSLCYLRSCSSTSTLNTATTSSSENGEEGKGEEGGSCCYVAGSIDSTNSNSGTRTRGCWSCAELNDCFSCDSCGIIQGSTAGPLQKTASHTCRRCLEVGSRRASLLTPARGTGEEEGAGEQHEQQQQQLGSPSSFSTTYCRSSRCNGCVVKRGTRVSEDPRSSQQQSFFHSYAREAELDHTQGSRNVESWDALNTKREIEETVVELRQHSDYSTVSTSSRYTSGETAIPEYGEALLLLLAGTSPQSHFPPGRRGKHLVHSPSPPPVHSTNVCPSPSLLTASIVDDPPRCLADALISTCSIADFSSASARNNACVTDIPHSGGVATADSVSHAVVESCSDPVVHKRKEEEEDLALIADIMEVLGLLPEKQEEQKKLKTIIHPVHLEGSAIDGEAAETLEGVSQPQGHELSDAPVQYHFSERGGWPNIKETVVTHAALEREEAAEAEEIEGDAASSSPAGAARQIQVSGAGGALGGGEAHTPRPALAAEGMDGGKEAGVKGLKEARLWIERAAARLPCTSVTGDFSCECAADVPAADAIPTSPCDIQPCAGERPAAASALSVSLFADGTDMLSSESTVSSLPLSVALSSSEQASLPSVISSPGEGDGGGVVCPIAGLHGDIAQQHTDSVLPSVLTCSPRPLGRALVPSGGPHSERENDGDVHRQQQPQKHYKQSRECEKRALKVPEEPQQQHTKESQRRQQRKDRLQEMRQKKERQQQEGKEKGEGVVGKEADVGEQQNVPLEHPQQHHEKEEAKQPGSSPEEANTSLISVIVPSPNSCNGLLLLHRSVYNIPTDASSSRISNAAEEGREANKSEELRGQQQQHEEQQLQRGRQSQHEPETSPSESGKSVVILEMTEVSTPEQDEACGSEKGIEEEDFQETESGAAEDRRHIRRGEATKQEGIREEKKEEEEHNRVAVLEEWKDKGSMKDREGKEEEETVNNDAAEVTEDGVGECEEQGQTVEPDEEEIVEKLQHLQLFITADASSSSPEEAGTQLSSSSTATAGSLAASRVEGATGGNPRCTEGARRGESAASEIGGNLRRGEILQQNKVKLVHMGEENEPRGTRKEEGKEECAERFILHRTNNFMAEEAVTERATVVVGSAIGAVAEKKNGESEDKTEEDEDISLSVMGQLNSQSPRPLKNKKKNNKRDYMLSKQGPLQKGEKKAIANSIQRAECGTGSMHHMHEGETEGLSFHLQDDDSAAGGGSEYIASSHAIPAEIAALKMGLIADRAISTPLSHLVGEHKKCGLSARENGRRRRRKQKKASLHLDRCTVSETAELPVRQQHCMHAKRDNATSISFFASGLIPSVTCGIDTSSSSPSSSQSFSLCSSSFSDTTTPSVVALEYTSSPVISSVGVQSALPSVHQCSSASASLDAAGKSSPLPASRAFGCCTAAPAAGLSTTTFAAPSRSADASRARQLLREVDETPAERSTNERRGPAETCSLVEKQIHCAKECLCNSSSSSEDTREENDEEAETRPLAIGASEPVSPTASLLALARGSVPVEATTGVKKGKYVKIQKEETKRNDGIQTEEKVEQIEQGIPRVLHKLWGKVKHKVFTQREILYATLLPSLVVAIIPFTAAVGLLALACLPVRFCSLHYLYLRFYKC